MRRKMKKIIILTISALLCMLFTACNKNSKIQKTIIVGTHAEYQPFDYLHNGKIVGFDIDIMKQIANGLNYKLKWKNMSFDGLIPALQMKKVDIIIAAMTPSAQRAKNVLFSQNYYISGSVVIIKKAEAEKIKNPANLEGTKIGVQLGTVQDELAGNIKDAKVVRYNSPAFALMDLNAGKLQAIIVDKAIKGPFLKKNPDLTSFQIKDKNSSGFAIVVRKDEPKLLKKVNTQINQIIKTEKYKKLLNKYLI
jgi:polar amino acid transport system substrate-binding protein